MTESPESFQEGQKLNHGEDTGKKVSPEEVSTNEFETVRTALEESMPLLKEEQQKLEVSGVLKKFSAPAQKVILGGLLLLSLAGVVSCTSKEEEPKKSHGWEEQMKETIREIQGTTKGFEAINKSWRPGDVFEKPALSEKEKAEMEQVKGEKVAKEFWEDIMMIGSDAPKKKSPFGMEPLTARSAARDFLFGATLAILNKASTDEDKMNVYDKYLEPALQKFLDTETKIAKTKNRKQNLADFHELMGPRALAAEIQEMRSKQAK